MDYTRCFPPVGFHLRSDRFAAFCHLRSQAAWSCLRATLIQPLHGSVRAALTLGPQPRPGWEEASRHGGQGHVLWAPGLPEGCHNSSSWGQARVGRSPGAPSTSSTDFASPSFLLLSLGQCGFSEQNPDAGDTRPIHSLPLFSMCPHFG